MKKIFLVMGILLLLVPVIYASPKAYGYIYIEIANREPELTNVKMTSFSKYPLESIDCTADVIDEVPQEAIIRKKWFVNGAERPRPTFNVGDEVICSLTPVDLHGLEGANYEISFRINEPKTAFDAASIIFLKY